MGAHPFVLLEQAFKVQASKGIGDTPTWVGTLGPNDVYGHMDPYNYPKPYTLM